MDNLNQNNVVQPKEPIATPQTTTSPAPKPVESGNVHNPINNAYQNTSQERKVDLDLPAEKKKEGEQDFKVHFMPKDFQDNNVVAGKHGKMNGIMIMIASLIFLALVSAGVYYYLIKPGMSPVDTVVNPAQNIVQNTPSQNSLETSVTGITGAEIPSLADQSPADQVKAVYQEYKINLATATSFNDYYVLVQNYGSAIMIQQAESDKLANKSLTEIKKNSPNFDGSEYLDADIKGNNLAVIKANVKDLNGTIIMKQENGAWKVESEEWDIPGVVNTPAVVLAMGIDTDGDGLTDLEETLLGTNKALVDTDADTYPDASELSNLYNPAGSGKLETNSHLAKYDEMGISFLYPGTWVKELSTDQKLLTFQGENNHRFQLFFVDSSSDLNNYYMSVFNVDQIKSSLKYEKNGWSGVYTENKLIMYVKKTGTDKIYILEYNVGPNDTTEYEKLFQALVNSFIIK